MGLRRFGNPTDHKEAHNREFRNRRQEAEVDSFWLDHSIVRCDKRLREGDEFLMR